MSTTSIIVTPLENSEKDPFLKGIASIHYGKSICATAFIRENKESGELYVSRPGYKDKNDEFNTYFGMKGEGSISEMNQQVLDEYENKLVGKENPSIEDVEISDIKVNVGLLNKANDPFRKGVASVVINDEFVLSSVTILNGKNGMYVSFPHSYNKDTKETKSCVEVLGSVKKEIEKAVLEAYDKKRAEVKDVEKEEVTDKSLSDKDQRDFMNIPDTIEEKIGDFPAR